MQYKLLDSGLEQKLESFGDYTLIRPCAQALWEPQQDPSLWQEADALFTREGSYRWEKYRSLPPDWQVELGPLRFLLKLTDFGHIGLFPEQLDQWLWIDALVAASQKPLSLLNLFAYAGGASLIAARAGAKVCHVDSAAGMVQWASENAKLNDLEKAPIRWIVEDARKFILRCQRRVEKFDAIILDPPSFGRGKTGEVFKIEEDLLPLLDNCIALLSDQPRFFLFSCHTPGYTPYVLKQLIEQRMIKQGYQGHVEAGEMMLPVEKGCFSVPSGTYVRWVSDVSL